MTQRAIGFFYDDKNLESSVANPNPWPGKDKFITNLIRVQRVVPAVYYKGYSECICCKKRIVGIEYSTDEFRWPQELLHYVKYHNVVIDQSFVDYINNFDFQEQDQDCEDDQPKSA